SRRRHTRFSRDWSSDVCSSDLGGDVLEQRLEVDLLLVAAAHGAAGGLPDDGHDGHVVEFGVVEPVEQVDRAGPGGGGADADAARSEERRVGKECSWWWAAEEGA